MSDVTDVATEKRIVLVGYQGSGKTMLAIGLNKPNKRKAVSINVSDTKAREELNGFVADIESKKKFPQKTALKNAQEAEESERRRYPFEFVGWRGRKFTTVIEDYAGERMSNQEYIKEFEKIIGKDPYGAILLLNPGMSLFRETEDLVEIKNRIELPNLYKTLVDKLIEKGCTNFVLAITASDRISIGGDLRHTEQHKNFKRALGGIEGHLKAIRRTKEGRKIEYKVVPVTVTGRLKYNAKGDAEEEHLAKDSENTAADPFLWIIDPWRERVRMWGKRLAWSALVSCAIFWMLYAGLRTWHGYNIESYLNEAESALGNFGKTESLDFDMERARKRLEIAESNLKKVNDAWFVGDSETAIIAKRLPGLLGTLMTNQVELAYKRLSPRIRDWTDFGRSLEGQDEFSQWSDWERSSLGKDAHDAAIVFRCDMTGQLEKSTLDCNSEFLVAEATKISPSDDLGICQFFSRAQECLKHPRLDNTHKEKLVGAVNTVIYDWEKDVKEKSESNEMIVRKRWGAAIPENLSIELNSGKTIDRASILCELIADKRGTEHEEAKEVIQKIDDGRSSLQEITSKFITYIQEHETSDYRWDVLDHAKKRFNNKVESLLAPVGKDIRKNDFGDVFSAARHLYNNLHGLDCWNEGTFGDNALYWLAPTNVIGSTYKTYQEWLQYDFRCEDVQVRTDHKTNNPGAEVFDKWVDAYIRINFEPENEKGGFPRDVGGERLIKGWHHEDGWTTIGDSRIHVKMAATDVLWITVKKGEEDWKWDVPIEEHWLDFMPGWEDVKDGHIDRSFAYDSKKDIYPNKALYCVRLSNVKVSGGPYEAFTHALREAKKHEPEITKKRNEALRRAEEERNGDRSNKEVR